MPRKLINFPLLIASISLPLFVLWSTGCGDQPNCEFDCRIDSPDVEPDVVCWRQNVTDAFGNVWLETCCLPLDPPESQPPDCFIS